MAAKKFDLITALLSDGFQLTKKDSEQFYIGETYEKHYSDGSDYSFDASVTVVFSCGRVMGVGAKFSNGKFRQYQYNKRAYNAIRDTIKNNGFEI